MINSIEELENYRLDVVKEKRKGAIVSLCTIAICAILFFVFQKFNLFNNIVCAFLLPVLAIVGGAVVPLSMGKKKFELYKKKYKEYFVLNGLENKFEDVNYVAEKGFDRSVIKDTHMMVTGDRYSSNDYISAKYKNIGFQQSDVLIEEEVRTDDSYYYVTIFRGRWIIFDFNKEFRANVQVCDKHFCGATRGGLFSKTKYKKVNLESEEFNEKFLVYAEDEHDAFYILTPSMMEKIQDLSKIMGGSLLLCFIDDKLHIGLNNHRDSFEPPSYRKPLNEELEAKKISYDISVITAFVDALDLDNDLFKKEV